MSRCAGGSRCWPYMGRESSLGAENARGSGRGKPAAGMGRHITTLPQQRSEGPASEVVVEHGQVQPRQRGMSL